MEWVGDSTMMCGENMGECILSIDPCLRVLSLEPCLLSFTSASGCGFLEGLEGGSSTGGPRRLGSDGRRPSGRRPTGGDSA